MAKIKFGEHGHLELEITPLTIGLPRAVKGNLWNTK